MRWNCPHCEELVTAGIDFENTKKAYVRCGKCNGMALIHRSAVLADYVKARRMEEEAQLEAELHFTQSAAANTRIHAMETQVRGLNAKVTAQAAQLAAPIQSRSTPPPPNSAMAMTMPMNRSDEMDMATEMSPTPPPFLSSFDMMDDDALSFNESPTPAPVFNYPKPPAFLLKPTASAIETIERSFAASDETPPLLKTKVPKTSRSPTIALWVAAALAVSSGAYLYVEGKKALAPVPSLPVPAQADAIHSKANSALRAGARDLVIVRVPRAILRSSPTMTANLVQTLDRATVASFVEFKDGWMKIESPKITTSDRTAWVRADLVARMPD